MLTLQVLCDRKGCTPTRSDYCNSYSSAAFDMDRFVFDHPDMLLLGTHFTCVTGALLVQILARFVFDNPDMLLLGTQFTCVTSALLVQTCKY